MSLTQTASRFSLTSSFVRPVLTDFGNCSASQPLKAAASRFLISSHCSESSSNAVVGAVPGRRLVRTIVDRLDRLRRLCLGLVGTPVPDDDIAGPVLALRDDPLEIEILERVVLDVDGHPADGRVERRALRNR